MKYNNIAIIGSGITGAFFAREFAEKGCNVTVFEVKSHIGGHIYDYVDENTGCIVHKYGPHIFHTSNEEVWDWSKKYTNFVPFELRNKAYIKEIDKWLNTPFGTHTAREILSEEEYVTLLKSFVTDYPLRTSIPVPELLNSKNEVVKKFGTLLWDYNYKLYTSKQWGIDPSEVDPEVLKRVPVYTSDYNRYFTDTYEGIPEKGYTKWIENILNHSNILIKLNHKPKIEIQDDYCVVDNITYDCVVYTGPIEELLNYKYGELKYRSLKFEFFETEMPEELYFGMPCVDVYPDHSFGFTRITNFGLLPIQKNLKKQISAKEYSYEYDRHDESLKPYYPVSTHKDKEIYGLYEEELTKVKNLVLAGRLGKYKYFNMDKAIEDSMTKIKELI